MKKIGIFLLAVLLLSGTIYAQQPEGDDPSPAENACNPGGALAGKCDTDWEWTCGWYLAQFYQGKVAGVPSTCQILIDMLPEQVRRPGALIFIPPYEPEAGSKGDNACNEGGSMAGKCDTDWEWTCGWYLARYEAAVFADVPSACQILVDLIPKPPKDTAVAAGSGADCRIFTGIAPESLICLNGNVLTFDLLPPDGVPDHTFILLSDTVAGPSGNCPLGTTYTDEVGTLTLVLQNFVVSRGFPLTGDRCRIL